MLRRQIAINHCINHSNHIVIHPTNYFTYQFWLYVFLYISKGLYIVNNACGYGYLILLFKWMLSLRVFS